MSTPNLPAILPDQPSAQLSPNPYWYGPEQPAPTMRPRIPALGTSTPLITMKRKVVGTPAPSRPPKRPASRATPSSSSSSSSSRRSSYAGGGGSSSSSSSSSTPGTPASSICPGGWPEEMPWNWEPPNPPPLRPYTPNVECHRCEDLFRGHLHEFAINRDDGSHYWMVQKPGSSSYPEPTRVLVDGRRPVVHHSFPDLQKSAMYGCPYCIFILMQLNIETRRAILNLDKPGPAFVYLCSYEGTAEPLPQGFTVRCDSAVQIRFYYGVTLGGQFLSADEERLTISLPLHGPCLGTDEPSSFGLMNGTIRAIHEWEQTCGENHTDCVNRKAMLKQRYPQGPERLLQLRWVLDPDLMESEHRPENDGYGEARVINARDAFHDAAGMPDYAVLSHLTSYNSHRLIADDWWLTHETQASLYRFFRWENLPATLRDTCRAAWGLGMRYVWIDTLCINTDSAWDVASYTLGQQLAHVLAASRITFIAELCSPQAGLLDQPEFNKDRLLKAMWPGSRYEGRWFAFGQDSFPVQWKNPLDRPSPLSAVSARWGHQFYMPAVPEVDLESTMCLQFADLELRWCCYLRGESDLYRLNYSLFDLPPSPASVLSSSGESTPGQGEVAADDWLDFGPATMPLM